MACEENTDKFYFEKCSIPIELMSDFEYIKVTDDDGTKSVDPSDEDLNTIVKSLNERDAMADAEVVRSFVPQSSVVSEAELPEDFVRNFLVSLGMQMTLDCFQMEWFRLLDKGLVYRGSTEYTVPDVYSQLSNLKMQLNEARHDREKYRLFTERSEEVRVSLQKERDFHRMHYRRVLQEKDKLLANIAHLKEHLASYQPSLNNIKGKYYRAMKEVTLAKLERNKIKQQLQAIQSSCGDCIGVSQSDLDNTSTPIIHNMDSQTVENENRHIHPIHNFESTNQPESKSKASRFPKEQGSNPNLVNVKMPSAYKLKQGSFSMQLSFQAHEQAVTCLKMHPDQMLLSTTSDDKTWKIWSLPSAELVLTGQGHHEWISSCDFHPSGIRLATTGGDGMLKIWDFTKIECIHTFKDHRKAVWGCSWHTCGDFIATCSMDNTCKIWDLNSFSCRQTLRGHDDSVNAVNFLAYSNLLVSSSADRNVRLWDARTNICCRTFAGHEHSINYANFNMRGNLICSCDSYGEAIVWDVGTGKILNRFNCGPNSANMIEFDPTGTVLAMASNDSTIRMIDLSNSKIGILSGHEQAVQCLLYDRQGDYVISGSSDLTVKIWN